jgi:hypothetical protein
MLRWATKDPNEREDTEAERLVRPSPKVKPPRRDKRREDIHPDKDPDTDETDADKSLNYKGGSARQVALRFAEDTIVVKNRKLDDVVWIRPDTLREDPSLYQKLPPSEPERDESKPRPPAQPQKPAKPNRHKDPLPHPEWPEQRPLPKSRLKPVRGPKPVKPIQPMKPPTAKNPPKAKPPGWVPENRTPSGRYASSRVLTRFLEARSTERYIKVRNKEKGTIVRVKEETLKKYPNSYEKITDDEENEIFSKQLKQLEGLAKDNKRLDGALHEILEGGPFQQIVKDSPDAPVHAYFPGVKWPPGIETLADLEGIVSLYKPKTKKPGGKTPPEAPAEAPAEDSEKRPKGLSRPSIGQKPGEEAKPPAEGGKKPSDNTLETERAKQWEDASKTPQGPKGPVLRTWADANSEQKEAAMSRLLKSNLPHDFQLSLINARMHPDDMQQVIAGYSSMMAGNAPSDAADYAEKASKHYVTDPSKVKPPKTGKDAAGNVKPFEEFSPEEQSEIMSDWRNKSLAFSMASRAQVAKTLAKKTGAPENLANHLAEFMLDRPENESPEDRDDRVERASEKYFELTLQQAEKASWKPQGKHQEDDEDDDGETSKDKKPKTKEAFDPKVIEGVLRQTSKDPAAQRLAVSFFQAHDYMAARKQFLDPESPDHISEFQSAQEIKDGLTKATDFLRSQSKKYPSKLVGPDIASTFRSRIVNRLQALVPETGSEIEDWVEQSETSEYEKASEQYEKDHRKYKKDQAKYDKAVDKLQKTYQKELDTYNSKVELKDTTAKPPVSVEQRIREEYLEPPDEGVQAGPS